MKQICSPIHDPNCPWHRRARHAVGHSLRIRLVLVFMALAVTVAVTFMGGVQKAVSVGWREAARPLLMDYVDRLAAEIGSPPSIERAQAIANRLPLTLRCLLYTSPSPRDQRGSRMPSSA